MKQKRVLSDFFWIPPTQDNFQLGYHVKTELDEATGKTKTFFKFALINVAQVMGITKDGKIITVEQSRDVIGQYPGLVGETAEPGESMIETGVRGLLEETGYLAGRASVLSNILRDSGRGYVDKDFGQKILILAEDCEKVRDGEKEIKVRLLEPHEFWQKMMEYFATSPFEPHGGGNSLELMAIAFHHLGFLKITGVNK
ncbi:MAG: hypothetical protein Q8P49_02705 [Candidatus Liptonbacteria bacterium]|nr:hypothetical protein [Candidatus Liptonbacteria bacterium]